MNRLRILFLLFLSLPSVIISQQITVGIGGGFSCANATTDNSFIYGSERMMWPGRFVETFGRKPDMGFHITSYFTLRSPSLPVGLIAGISYTQLYGKSDSVIADTPPWFDMMYTTGVLKTRRNILTIKTGVQWEILHSPIVPYISFALLYNIMSDTRLSIQSPSGVIEARIEGAARMGLSLGAGANFNVFPSINACIEAAYSLNNLVGVEDGEKKQYVYTISTGLLFSFN